MYAAPEAYPIDLGTFHSEIAMKYTLTPGRAAGTFLAEVKNRRFLGARFADGTVLAPPQDVLPSTGAEMTGFVEAPHTGVLTAFTRAGGVVIGLIKLDGCDNAFPHRVLADLDALSVGLRVEAVWKDGVADSIMAVEGFRPAPAAPVGIVAEIDNLAEPLGAVPYALSLPYEHSYGPYYGRLFDEMREFGRIIGTRTSSGDDALLPPRETDDVTHKRTGTWKACADTGTIRGCSIINMEFVGQTREPPYVYAEIVLDGASTRLIHMIDIDDVETAKRTIKPGTRVRAVWTKGERRGSLTDIERFEVIE